MSKIRTETQQLHDVLNKLREDPPAGWGAKVARSGGITITTPRGIVRVSPDYDDAAATAALRKLRDRGLPGFAFRPRRPATTLPAFEIPVPSPEPTPAPRQKTKPAFPGDPSPDEGPVRRTLVVTPAMAREFLDRPYAAVTSDGRTLRQRALLTDNVEFFIDLIRSGRFQALYQGAGIGLNGSLYDGQHRFHAIWRTGKPVEMTINYNVHPDHIEHLDSGRKRGAATKLMMEGRKNTVQLGSSARLMKYILEYEAAVALGNTELVSHWTKWHNIRLSDQVVLDMVHNYDGLALNVDWAVTQPQTKPTINIPALAIFRYLIQRLPGDSEEMLSRFLNSVVCGIGIDSVDHIALRLKNWIPEGESLVRRTGVREAHLNMLIHAWNYYIDGRSQIRLPASFMGEFPLPRNVSF